ncbi:MAG: hypothetical protein GW778_08445 [Alphaproteobacteria bacterium]|nr:hypothetical protein [Alphaproteobacteria bacterium]
MLKGHVSENMLEALAALNEVPEGNLPCAFTRAVEGEPSPTKPAPLWAPQAQDYDRAFGS